MLTIFSKVLIITVFAGGAIGGAIAVALKQQKLINKSDLKEKLEKSYSDFSNNEISPKTSKEKMVESDKLQVSSSESLEKINITEESSKNAIDISNNSNILEKDEALYELDFSNTKNREILEKKWDQEIKDDSILLEAAWQFGIGGEHGKLQENCITLKSGYDQLKNLRIDELADNEDTCRETFWTRYLLNKYGKEGVWIRGEKGIVTKLIKDNLRDWNPKFYATTYSMDSSNPMDFLNGIYCKQKEKDDNWTNITCLENWALLDEINSEGYIKDTVN
ncbi:hypothetical protein [Mycoplasma parvum]|uniref:Uncharacterized protein n=1 Tax=Mycoplasma parvum str. Indiana TaxID=1403316 RepID=U5NGA4_9MOLU|nr:hypothetical protein [Mycoplasma parvum]AGX89303.1 hypothetical protein PRV_02885 [Mycoplasma parvum str. Indiana]